MGTRAQSVAQVYLKCSFVANAAALSVLATEKHSLTNYIQNSFLGQKRTVSSFFLIDLQIRAQIVMASAITEGLRRYTVMLSADPTNTLALNRSPCHMQLQGYESAL